MPRSSLQRIYDAADDLMREAFGPDAPETEEDRDRAAGRILARHGLDEATRPLVFNIMLNSMEARLQALLMADSEETEADE